MWQTRREFLKTAVAGTAGLMISSLDLKSFAATMNPPRGWSGAPGQAHYRIDGLAKVTGQKIYARDFRPVDLPAWPTRYHRVLVVFSTFTDHIFDGLNLNELPKALQPVQVITAAELTRDKIGIAKEDYPAGQYLLPSGEQPAYLGQALAILLYDDPATYESAKQEILFNGRGVRKGKKVPPRAPSYFMPETSIIHVVDEQGGEQFSQTMKGPVHPAEAGELNTQAMGFVEMIGEKLASDDLDVHQHTYHTPMVDPMFMEPESGLAWFDREAKTLRMLIGTQSPGYDINASLDLFAPKDCPIDIDDVHLYAAYPGGGFGGRDTSIFCLYLALAAAYSDKPVRIAHDRFQQFQSGVKRHAANIELTVGVTEENHFAAIRDHSILNGGGRRNVSNYVAAVNALTGPGAYRFPLADIWTRPQRTDSQVAGSMRGFGAYQSTFAIESMVDEIAMARGIDALELRKMNLLLPHESIVTGAPKAPPGLHEICDAAAAHPLWIGRQENKKSLSNGDEAYGVGASVCIKNYGSGADAVMSQVRIDAQGQVYVTTNCVDMGQGAATVHALATAQSLGRNADGIETGQTEVFRELKLFGSFNQEPDNPRWTPIVWNSTKASAGVARWVHATEQASRVLLETALLPAARSIWGAAANGLDTADVVWSEGRLTSGSFDPIPMAVLAKELHNRDLATSAMVHAFYSGRWIEANYTVDGITHRWPIDALAVQRGGSETYDLIDRENPKLFTTESVWEGNGQNFSAAGALTAVKVNRKTGEVRLVQGVHFLAPGSILQQDLLEGQMEGGWAMGVGHCLFEELPIGPKGAADGSWNLNRYHVALAGDCAIHNVEKVIIPPDKEDPSPRGIAEVVMNPLAPAIANAIAHATGQRFRSLPITPAKVRAAWKS